MNTGGQAKVKISEHHISGYDSLEPSILIDSPFKIQKMLHEIVSEVFKLSFSKIHSSWVISIPARGCGVFDFDFTLRVVWKRDQSNRCEHFLVFSRVKVWRAANQWGKVGETRATVSDWVKYGAESFRKKNGDPIKRSTEPYELHRKNPKRIISLFEWKNVRIKTSLARRRSLRPDIWGFFKNDLIIHTWHTRNMVTSQEGYKLANSKTPLHVPKLYFQKLNFSTAIQSYSTWETKFFTIFFENGTML